MPDPLRILIACETSGVMRRAFAARHTLPGDMAGVFWMPGLPPNATGYSYDARHGVWIGPRVESSWRGLPVAWKGDALPEE